MRYCIMDYLKMMIEVMRNDKKKAFDKSKNIRNTATDFEFHNSKNANNRIERSS